VWDPNSGVCLHTLRGHPGTWISHLAVLPNGQLVSGGLDHNLRFWL
jgi:WD40 repeat protein